MVTLLYASLSFAYTSLSSLASSDNIFESLIRQFRSKTPSYQLKAKNHGFKPSKLYTSPITKMHRLILALFLDLLLPFTLVRYIL